MSTSSVNEDKTTVTPVSQNIVPLSIFVVDDSRITLNSISKILRSAEYDVEVECDSSLVLSKLKRNVYDIVLLDLFMPYLSGLEITSSFRDYESKSNPFKKQIIIGMCSYLCDSKLKDVLSAGMNSILVKPFTLSKFENLTGLKRRNIETNCIETNVQTIAPILNVKSRRLKILVVDDSPTILKLTTRMLVQEGHQVDSNRNGREAINSLQSENYDVVFMDINMPQMGGWEASLEFRIHESDTFQRRSDLNQKQKIIGMTGDINVLNSQEASLSSFDTIIEKPLTIAKFRQILDIIN
jgi:CheY-like chemotaxis protein